MGIVGDVIRALKDWEPGRLRKEIEYQKSVEAHLRRKLPNARIEREYRHDGTTVDLFLTMKKLVFKYELFMEVKLNLKRKADYDRLIGQVVAMKPGKRQIVVVLCGDTDPKWVDRFKEEYERFFDGPISYEEMGLVVK